jgi:hypothetical protein
MRTNEAIPSPIPIASLMLLYFLALSIKTKIAKGV